MAFGRKLRKGAIDSDRIKDASILAADIKLFVSAVQTGTGSAQSIPHGLGVTPTKVFISITESPATYAALTTTEGTHDATNCVFTVTSGWKYKVIAIA